MLYQELISLNVGLCSPNFAQRYVTSYVRYRTYDVEYDVVRLTYDVVRGTYDIVRRRHGTMAYLARIQMLFGSRFSKKNVSGAYIVSAHFGKQHINFVIPIIDFVPFFTTGGLTNARKRLFNLHLMNTEDHLFPHNGLTANISGIQHPKFTD
jgi:hypothetical protein